MTRLTAILLAVLVVASVVPAPAVADHEDDTESILNSVVSDDGGMIAQAQGIASGIYQRTQAFFEARGDDQSPSEHASDLKSTFNANNDSIQTYVNARSTASTGADVLKLTLAEEGEDSASVYIVADVNSSSGDYENASMVDSTDRTVDEECTLKDSATRNAADELDTFVTRYADTSEDTTKRYKAELVTEYSGKISCSFL